MMKKALLFLFFLATLALAAPSYTKYASNPVITNTTAFECQPDAKAIEGSGLIEDGWMHVWYRTCDITYGTHGMVIYANSTDGINFGNKTVAMNNSDGWLFPEVIKVNNSYHMFLANESNNDIYHYNSTDKVNWTDFCGGAAISGTYYNPAVHYDTSDDTWHMLLEYSTGHFTIGYWNSTDGCSFDAYGSNPVLDYGGNGWLYKNGSTWYAYYGNSTGNWNLDWANTTTPWSWTVQENDVLGGPTQGWEDTHISDPFIIIPDDADGWEYSYYLYYNGDQNRIGLAYETNNQSFYDAHHPTAAAAGGGASNGTYEMPCYINTTVDEVLYNFPARCMASTIDLVSDGKLNANCSDLRVYNSEDDTELEYKIEGNTCNTSRTWVWFNIPETNASGTGNTTVWLHYGNASATSNENSSAVWINNYTTVYLMEEDAFSGTSEDQAGSDHDGTYTGSGEIHNDTTTCKFGQCIYLNADSEYILGAGHDAQTTNTTITMWLYHNSTDTNPANWMLWAHPTADYYWYITQTGKLWGAYATGKKINTTDGIWANDTLVFLSHRIDVTTLSSSTFGKDDSTNLTVSNDHVAIGDAMSSYRLGYSKYANNRWQGYIDYYAESSIIRSDNWLKAEYGQTSSTGSEQEIGSATVYFVSPTPAASSTEYDYGMVFNITLTSGTFGAADNYIEVDGVNKTCTLSSDSTSCSWTPGYSDHNFTNTYDLKAYGNISGSYTEGNETRSFDYYGCGRVYADGTMTGNANMASGSYCFELRDSDITLDCGNYWINGSVLTSIYASSKNNINIYNCNVNESNTMAFDATGSINVTIKNMTINNSAGGLDLGSVSNATLMNFTMVDSSGQAVASSSGSLDASDITLENVSPSLNAVYLSNTAANISDVTISHVNYPLYVYSDVGYSLTNFTMAHGLEGMVIKAANGSTFTNFTMYNYSDFYIEAQSDVQDITLTNFTIDNPAGGLSNYTRLDISYVSAVDVDWRLNWSLASASIPTGFKSFEDKVVNFSAASGSPSIDNVTFYWDSSEIGTDYNESDLRLYRYDGSWTEVNGTPDTTNNNLILSDISTFGEFAILQELGSVSITDPPDGDEIYGDPTPEITYVIATGNAQNCWYEHNSTADWTALSDVTIGTYKFNTSTIAEGRNILLNVTCEFFGTNYSDSIYFDIDWGGDPGAGEEGGPPAGASGAGGVDSQDTIIQYILGNVTDEGMPEESEQIQGIMAGLDGFFRKVTLVPVVEKEVTNASLSVLFLLGLFLSRRIKQNPLGLNFNNIKGPDIWMFLGILAIAMPYKELLAVGWV